MRIATTTLAITIALCLSATAQPYQRQAQPGRFYVFGEYDYYTDSSDFRGGGVGLGWNFNPYLGVQAGAQFLGSSFRNIGNASVNGDVDTMVYYGEAKFSLPMTDGFSLYGSVGMGYGDATAHVTMLNGYPYAASVSNNAMGYRIGVGAEYWFSRHWGLRASWHQIEVDGTGNDLGVGIALRF